MKLTIMRCIGLLAAGLVLTVSGPASAGVTVPTLSDGWNALQSRNGDNGTFYTSATTPQTFDADRVPANVTVTPAPGAMLQRNLVGALTGDTPNENEDSWGIFLMYNISPGALINGGTAVNAIGSPTYSNDSGQQGTWLVGIFWGADDQTVSLRTPGLGKAADLNVRRSALNFELWAVDATNLAADRSANSLTAYNAALRTAYNRYTGWVDGGLVDDGISGRKLLTGTSTYSAFDGTVANAGYFSGDTTVYFDVPRTGANVGLWNGVVGENELLTAPDGTTADAYMTWRLQQSTNGWDAKSQDFGGFYATPEPTTLSLLALGGLLALHRRRRQ